MNPSEIDSYRQQLVDLRSRLTGDFSQLEGEALRHTGGEASGGLSSVPIHMADLGTDNYEEEMTLGLLENADQLLEEICAALTRIDEGSFGRCEECGQTIAKVRLQALPYARHCLACARRFQSEASERE